MSPCQCGDCEPGCDQYADPESELCYDCDQGDHLPERDEGANA